MITICSNNNNVLTWYYKDNNKYNKNNDVIISQTIPVEYFSSKLVCHVSCDNLNTLLSFKSNE